MEKSLDKILNGLSETLSVNDIDWMPKSCYQWRDSVMCQILPYKDARVDQQRLDDVCGGFWQNDFRRDSKEVLQGGIGIYSVELKEWIWRWSNGTPSEFESEKGEYSDALKRAGFMWGIGRELYAFPFVAVQCKEEECEQVKGRWKPTRKIKPNNWAWKLEWPSENEDGTPIPFTLIAKEKIGGKWVERYNANPHNSVHPVGSKNGVPA